MDAPACRWYPWLGMSWSLVALLFVIVSGLANPRTRPFVIGLVALVGLGLVFSCFVLHDRFATRR